MRQRAVTQVGAAERGESGGSGRDAVGRGLAGLVEREMRSDEIEFMLSRKRVAAAALPALSIHTTDEARLA